MSRLTLGLLAVTFAKASYAEVPRVVTDIAPVHSLVAQVMDGVGEPSLLVEPGADPHNAAMRPSQAAALEAADTVIVIGPALTAWLEKPLEGLAARANVVRLLDADGTTLLDYRGGHSHDHGHDHSDTDPHAWLDPGNAQVWLSVIADELAKADPDRSDIYQSNAADARASLEGIVAGLAVNIGAYGVHHDAFQYLEAPLRLAPAFIIQEDDAHQPGPARIAELRTQVAESDIACVFVERGANHGLVETVLEGSDAKILELDPLGAAFEPGAALYQQLLQNLLDTMRQCR